MEIPYYYLGRRRESPQTILVGTEISKISAGISILSSPLLIAIPTHSIWNIIILFLEGKYLVIIISVCAIFLAFYLWYIKKWCKLQLVHVLSWNLHFNFYKKINIWLQWVRPLFHFWFGGWELIWYDNDGRGTKVVIDWNYWSINWCWDSLFFLCRCLIISLTSSIFYFLIFLEMFSFPLSLLLGCVYL